MANTIKTGTILIREGALLPESLLIESEPLCSGWRLVKRLDIDGMSQTIGKAGWAFLYMAGVIRTSVFGSDEEKTTLKAIKRVVEHMRSKKFNCLEITQVVSGTIPVAALRDRFRPFAAYSRKSGSFRETRRLRIRFPHSWLLRRRRFARRHNSLSVSLRLGCRDSGRHCALRGIGLSVRSRRRRQVEA